MCTCTSIYLPNKLIPGQPGVMNDHPSSMGRDCQGANYTIFICVDNNVKSPHPRWKTAASSSSESLASDKISLQQQPITAAKFCRRYQEAPRGGDSMLPNLKQKRND